MLKFEVFTSESYDARMIADHFNGEIQAYNVTDDEECFIVTFTSRYSHKSVVSRLMPFSFEEVISQKV